MDKKETTLQEKANMIAGFKHYVESKKAMTKSTFDHIFYDICLLSIIGEHPWWRDLFIPKGTHLICKRIPKDFKPNGIINNNPASFLELEKTYTIKESVVGESFSWYELEEFPKYRVQLSWFEIAEEDRITPQQAPRLYSSNIDEEYEYVREYLERENERRRQEEEKKPKELFNYNGLRFDYFTLDNYDEDFKGEDYVHIDLCEECVKKWSFSKSLLSPEPYNGLPYDSYCSTEDCYKEAVYGYAIPLKDGKIVYEQKNNTESN